MSRIGTINIAGCYSKNRQNAIYDFVLNSNFDVIGFQEVSFDLKPPSDDFVVINNRGPNNLGTALVIRKCFEVSEVIKQPDGRILSAKIGNVTFINIYAPAGVIIEEERNRLYREVLPVYTSTAKSPIVLLGDFNAVENIGDKTSSIKRKKSSLVSKALINFISASNLVDVWRKMKKSEKGHTFFYKNRGGGSSRLDRFYVTPILLQFINEINTSVVKVSDHMCVTIVIDIEKNSKSRLKEKGLWKMNSVILKEEDFRLDFEKKWNNIIRHPLRGTDIIEWWSSVVKVEIKKLCIRFSIERSKRIKNTREFYQTCLEELAEEINRGIDV